MDLSERGREMADRKNLLDSVRGGLSTIAKRLRSVSSLARCKDGARRDFLAKEFIKKFEGVSLDDFDEALYDFMTAERPEPRSVQSLIQVLIEINHDPGIETVLDSIDARIGGGTVRPNASPSRSELATQDAWWGEVILEPFEKSFSKKPRLREKVRTLMSDVRKHTQATVS